MHRGGVGEFDEPGRVVGWHLTIAALSAQIQAAVLTHSGDLPGLPVWGTLCAADSAAADDVGAHLPTMRMFAQLIGAAVEREEAVNLAREEAATDPLTRCASRRVVERWLAAQLAVLSSSEVVVVAYADLDRFKDINDALGHAAGDAVLVEVGHRLRAASRQQDLVARLGGDEFLIATRVPRSAAKAVSERVEAALDFSLSWQGTSVHVHASVGIAVSDGIDDGPALVAIADAAMYADKHLR